MALNIGKVDLFGTLRGKFSCKWTIAHFSSLHWQDERDYICAPIKRTEECIKWGIRLSFRKTSENTEIYVFIRVFVISDENTNFKLTNFEGSVYLFNNNNEVIWLKDDIVLHHCSMKRFDWSTGYLKTKDRESLISTLVNDTLVISVKAKYFVAHMSNKSNAQNYGEFCPTLKLSEDFKNLWTSRENTDCVISVGSKDIPVHSLILGARSKVFAAMFRHDTLEKRTRLVKVTDFNKKTMNSFLEFIYSGKMPHVDVDLALELLRASDKYEVSDLKLHCSNYLLLSLNNDNACRILVSADMCNAERLRGSATKYVIENFSSADDFEANRPIFQDRPRLLYDLVKTWIERQEAAKKHKLDGQSTSGTSANKRPRNQ